MASSSQAVIAFGSNIEPRLTNIINALQSLRHLQITITALSRLYETAPAYVTDQPSFLNAAALIQTPPSLQKPLDLLDSIKSIEKSQGRDLISGPRYGPRPIDMDIIFHSHHPTFLHERLVIPHPRWKERDFVKAPIADLPLSPLTQAAIEDWERIGGETRLGREASADLRAVLPMGRLGLWSLNNKPAVMGILNITPDSFSDGGKIATVDQAVKAAREMLKAGADMLDVGGQSTRPGATRVNAEEEAERVVPIIKAISTDPHTCKVPLSIDTFYSQVAREAVQAGATMVNDVSGGTLDANMHSTVAALGVPYVCMHMRGTPQTMQGAEYTGYDHLVGDVGREMAEAAHKAMLAGIESWRLILDPGIGFAKTSAGNFKLLGSGLDELKSSSEYLMPPLNKLPMLVGPSRKGFLGEALSTAGGDRDGGRERGVEERDVATAAAAAIAVNHGANIIRAHNVGMVKDAVRVADCVNKACW
jgi:2-amino-4-hydroxy-6-hydroxymethyldihydropteridine diphosphokinase / dihydropteroate synthase